MPITVTGAKGTLWWGWHPAAILRAWTMTRTEAGTWSVTGTLSDVDDLAVSQRPLTLTVASETWPITELQITGASCTAVLGPKESADVGLSTRQA